MRFADIGLSDELLKAVTEAGYDEPTPIQAAAIPQVQMMRDIDRDCADRNREDRELRFTDDRRTRQRSCPRPDAAELDFGTHARTRCAGCRKL